MNGEILHSRALFLRTFGSSALFRRGTIDDEILLEPSKLLALIVYLAFSPARTATRDGLIDLLWSELEPDAGRHALRQHLWQLKRRVGAELVVEGRDQLILRSPIDSDRTQFVAASERSDFRQAVDLYAGDFFPGFAASGAGEFERWVDTERAELRSRFMRCADVVVKELLNSHHAKDAVALARRVRSTDPLRQQGWRLLLESLLASGDVISAAVECESLERMVEEEELPIELATKSLIATVRRAGLPRRTEVRGTLNVELVGREREFAMLVDAWERAKRRSTTLMRIEGPAGLGKTRLLAEFHARLDSLQARCVFVRANAGSTTVPFSLASDLAEKLGVLPGARAVSPQALRILVALSPSLSSSFDATPHASSPADLSTHRLSAIRELVAAIAAERPLAILIDDLHWADHASRTVIAGMQGSLSDTAVLLCVSSRQAASDPGMPANVSTIVLDPLGESAVLSLLSSVASLPPDPWADRLVGTLLRLSHGVPLYLVEALQLALQQGHLQITDGNWSASDADRLWRQFDSGEVLLHRISLLDRAEMRLLRALACAAYPLPEDVALRAGTDAGMSGNAALNGLIQKGLVMATDGQVVITHDEMSALVLQGTSPAEQTRIRRELGKALAEGDKGDPQRQRLAAAQLRATESDRELKDLFNRYVSGARRRDDHRSTRVLSNELLGDSASDAEIRALARSLSVGARIRAFGLTRTVAIAGVGFGLAGSAIGVTALARDPVDPPAAVALQVDVRDESGTYHVYLLPLPDDVTSDASLVVRRADKPVLSIPQVRAWRNVAQPGVPNRWLTVRDVTDSGQTDIYLLEPGREDKRLTFARGDDVTPEWSPDGRWIAFATSRWDSLGHTDIAIMPSTGGSARQITTGHSTDKNPLWSPDGTRIAFARRNFSSPEVEFCIATLDDSFATCHATGAESVVGWLNDSSVAGAYFDQASGRTATTVFTVQSDGLRIGSTLPVDAKAISSDGDWYIGRCSLATNDFCLTSRESPTHGRRIVAEKGTIAMVDFVRLRRPDYIDSVTVRNQSAVASLGFPFVIDAMGWTASGKPGTLPWLRIRSLDTTSATVDRVGRVVGRKPGAVSLEVSAGGWRADTVSLTIAPVVDSLVLLEHWQSLTIWEPFGEPVPELTAGDRNNTKPALYVAGDGVYHSGVRSRSPVPWAGGITIRTQLSTPLTQRQWQGLAIALMGTQKPGPLPYWDSRAGYAWGAGGFTEGCSLYVPVPSEGENSLDSLAIMNGGEGTGPVRSPAIVRTGAWYSAVLQLFPDGRCGAAINGEVVAITQPWSRNSDSLYIGFFGNSVGTRILVGETTVSLGVATDIDWDRLPTKPTR